MAPVTQDEIFIAEEIENLKKLPEVLSGVLGLIQSPPSSMTTRKTASQKSNQDQNIETACRKLTALKTSSESFISNVTKIEKTLREMNGVIHILQTLQAKVKQQDIAYENISSKQNDLTTRFSVIEKENTALREKIATLESRSLQESASPHANRNTARGENSQRRSQNRNGEKYKRTVFLVSRDQLSSSNVRDAATDLLKKIPGVTTDNIGEEDCQLIQKRQTEDEPPSSSPKIKVLLPTIEFKRELFKKFFQIEGDKPFFLNESLSKKTSELFYRARTLKKEKSDKIKSVFTHYGVICYQLHGENETIKKIRNDNDLEALRTKIYS